MWPCADHNPIPLRNAKESVLITLATAREAGPPAGRPRSGRRRVLVSSVLAAACLAGTCLTGLNPTSALADVNHASTTHATSPLSAFGPQVSGGARIPGFAEYLATGPQATTNGSVIGPDYTQGTLASEAVGREAVQLTAAGQYVQFTLAQPANAIDVD